MTSKNGKTLGRPRGPVKNPVPVRIEQRLIDLWQEIADARKTTRREMLTVWIQTAAREEITKQDESL
jgi:hypothetical protein